jgi:hypothetical protein
MSSRPRVCEHIQACDAHCRSGRLLDSVFRKKRIEVKSFDGTAGQLSCQKQGISKYTLVGAESLRGDARILERGFGYKKCIAM